MAAQAPRMAAQAPRMAAQACVVAPHAASKCGARRAPAGAHGTRRARDGHSHHTSPKGTAVRVYAGGRSRPATGVRQTDR